MRFSKQGFTLVELSLVLLIIGLLIGGIVTGKDLIRTATLRSLGSQLDGYQLAVITFREKYNCLPGDCARAEQFLGSAAGGCPFSAPATGTCNGNGNGSIERGVHLITTSETSRLWEMLSLARLIPGSYRTDGYFSNAMAGVTCPLLPRGLMHHPQGGVYIARAEDTSFSPFQSGHVISIGTIDQTWAHSHPILTPSEAYEFDAKFDNGMPDSGSIRANPVYGGPHPSYGGCYTGNRYRAEDTFTFAYQTNNSGTGCALAMKAGF